jgi:hypothetical protein
MQVKNAPQIRDNINCEDLPNTKTRSHSHDSSEPEDYSSVGPHKLPVLMGLKHDSISVEVCGDTFRPKLCLATI